MSIPATLKLKYLNGETRRINADDLSFEGLTATLKQIWGDLPFVLTYKDEDGDAITVSSAADLAESFVVARALNSKVLTFSVFPTAATLRATFKNATNPADGMDGPVPGTGRLPAAVHPGIVCDKSDMNPIVGVRYHILGNNYDLCEAEFAKLPESERVKFVAIAEPGAGPVPCFPGAVAYHPNVVHLARLGGGGGGGGVGGRRCGGGGARGRCGRGGWRHPVQGMEAQAMVSGVALPLEELFLQKQLATMFTVSELGLKAATAGLAAAQGTGGLEAANEAAEAAVAAAAESTAATARYQAATAATTATPTEPLAVFMRDFSDALKSELGGSSGRDSLSAGAAAAGAAKETLAALAAPLAGKRHPLADLLGIVAAGAQRASKHLSEGGSERDAPKAEAASEAAAGGGGGGGSRNERKAVHPGVVCDKSGMSPIVGVRYHVLGNNYDLCEAEFAKLPESERVLFVAIAEPGASPVPCFPAAQSADEAAADEAEEGRAAAELAKAKEDESAAAKAHKMASEEAAKKAREAAEAEAAKYAAALEKARAASEAATKAAAKAAADSVAKAASEAAAAAAAEGKARAAEAAAAAAAEGEARAAALAAKTARLTAPVAPFVAAMDGAACTKPAPPAAAARRSGAPAAADQRALDALAALGFQDAVANRALLARFGGQLDQVVNHLLDN